MPDSGDTIRPAAAFVTTRWTQVLSARGDSPEAHAAFSDLCSAYYAPVLAFIRRTHPNEDTARDLAQGFFAQLIALRGLGTVKPGHGRFRSYLLGAVKNYLFKQHDRESAAKRGGGLAPVSIDAGADTSPDLQIADPAEPVADTFFDKQWALAVVNRALSVMALETDAEGKGQQWLHLKPWLLGEVPNLSQADAARALNMGEGAVKVAIHRLRKRFREVVKAEIAETVDDPGHVREELRYLVEVLSNA